MNDNPDGALREMYDSATHQQGGMDHPPASAETSVEYWHQGPLSNLPRAFQRSLAPLPSGFQDLRSSQDLPGQLDPVPPEVLNLSSRPNDTSVHPMLSLFQDPPWDFQRITGVIDTRSHPPDGHDRERRGNPYSYRSAKPAPSEAESQMTAKYLSDSGYGTRSCVSRSDFSAEQPDRSQETQSLTGDFNEIRLRQDDVRHIFPQDELQEEILAPPSSWPGGHTLEIHASETLNCSRCEHTSKNLSEFR